MSLVGFDHCSIAPVWCQLDDRHQFCLWLRYPIQEDLGLYHIGIIRQYSQRANDHPSGSCPATWRDVFDCLFSWNCAHPNNHSNLGHVNFLGLFCFPNIEVSWLKLKVWGSVRPLPAKVDHMIRMHIFEPTLLLEYDWYLNIFARV